MENERRICSKCKIEKDIEEFAFRSKTKNIRKRKCRTCTSRYGKKHYKDNKKKYVARVRKNNNKYSLRNKQYVLEYLLTHPCVDCGEDDIIVLDFDHKKDKKSTISKMLKKGLSLSTIKNEIDKCDVRCANCHRRKTAEERGDYFKSNVLSPVRGSNS